MDGWMDGEDIFADIVILHVRLPAVLQSTSYSYEGKSSGNNSAI